MGNDLAGFKITGTRTQKKWRNLKYGYELPKKWRKDFDWLSDEEYDMENFALINKRYYALSEFVRTPESLEKMGWHGIHNDSYFSGVLIAISDDGEQYKSGLILS